MDNVSYRSDGWSSRSNCIPRRSTRTVAEIDWQLGKDERGPEKGGGNNKVPAGNADASLRKANQETTFLGARYISCMRQDRESTYLHLTAAPKMVASDLLGSELPFARDGDYLHDARRGFWEFLLLSLRNWTGLWSGEERKPGAATRRLSSLPLLLLSLSLSLTLTTPSTRLNRFLPPIPHTTLACRPFSCT